MPTVRILLVLLALVSPARAQDGARDAAAAREAAQAFQVYIEGVTKKGGRADVTRPDVAAMLGRVFDLDALNALPPEQGSDRGWLLDWMDAANTTNKLLMFNSAKLPSQPDWAALQRNMTEYGDQYAAALNFTIRLMARQAVSGTMFMEGLSPQERTSVREKGYAGFRTMSANMIVENVCAVIQSGGKPANVRLVTAAVRDTRAVWASFFLQQDRARVIELLAPLAKQTPDETARTDLAAFTTALQAVN